MRLELFFFTWIFSTLYHTNVSQLFTGRLPTGDILKTFCACPKSNHWIVSGQERGLPGLRNISVSLLVHLQHSIWALSCFIQWVDSQGSIRPEKEMLCGKTCCLKSYFYFSVSVFVYLSIHAFVVYTINERYLRGKSRACCSLFLFAVAINCFASGSYFHKTSCLATSLISLWTTTSPCGLTTASAEWLG